LGRPVLSIEENECRAIAEDIQRQRPGWLVIWGCYTRRFWAYPKFNTRGRVIIYAAYPDALLHRMDEGGAQIAHSSQPERRPRMTQASDESGYASLQLIINKSQARRTVTAMLDGSGLQVRQLKRELVISNPTEPEKGRIHVEYANGYVSCERTVWEHWGPLQGYADEGADTEIHVDAKKIIDTLGGDAQETDG
jgi:hypothetical protein